MTSNFNQPELRFHNLQTYYDFQLRTISRHQRIIFGCIALAILVVSVIANVLTIVVVIRRKTRPFFRVCLLSSAISDLLTTTLQCTTYLTQFSSDFVQVWHLGEFMCKLTPFMTASTILASSMTLIGIAVDRFVAVKKIIRHGFWEPNELFSNTYIIFIWSLSAGIASPMISTFFIYDIRIGITNPRNHTVVVKVLREEMCASEKHTNIYYYVMVFAIVFVPVVLVFIWLLTVVFRQIWQQYKLDRTVRITRTTELSSSVATTTTTSCNNINCLTTSNDNFFITKRENKRKFRLFCIVLALLGAFISLRMPTWIYLLMRRYGTFNEKFHWILYFIFGQMSLLNCILNPFLYAFVTESIKTPPLYSSRTAFFCTILCRQCHRSYSTTTSATTLRNQMDFLETTDLSSSNCLA